jgi:hypothetical protein
MALFKEGDRVICMDDSEMLHLKINVVYTVKRVNDIYVILEELNQLSDYRADRFILATPLAEALI